MFKYQFKSDNGLFMVVTTDRKLTAKEIKKYLSINGHAWTYTRGWVNNEND